MRLFRLFVSSPADCENERQALAEVVDRLNRVGADTAGLRLQLFTWKGDVIPQIGPGPQIVVDEQTPPYDVFIGIMSARFGGDDKRESGTEQEARRALRLFENTGAPWILFYF